MEIDNLIVSSRRGDRAATEVLMAQFRPLIIKTAARYRGVSFEDALQEAWLAFWRCVQTYVIGGDVPFAGYVAIMVRGETRTAMRRMWTAHEREAYPDAHNEEETSESWLDLQLIRQGTGGNGAGNSLSLDVIEYRMLMQQAGLSPREQLCLEGLMAGWTTSELAAKLGVSKETAKTWRKRGVAKMRRALSRD